MLLASYRRISTMSDPHWLIQELAGNAAWTAVGVGAAYAWSYYKAKRREPVLLSGTMEGGSYWSGELQTVGSERGASWDVLASVGSERTALWNIEAPSRDQLKRLGGELLELGAWYLHHR